MGRRVARPALRVATLQECAQYGGTLPRGLVPPIGGASGIAPEATVFTPGDGTTTGGPASQAFTPSSATWTVGDLMFAVGVWESAATVSSFTGGSGAWTQLGATQVNTSTQTMAVFYKVFAAGDDGAAQTLTISTGSRFVMAACAFSGVASASFIDSNTFGTNASSTNMVAPSITTVAASTFLITVWTDHCATGSAGTLIAEPGTHTRIVRSSWNQSNGSVSANISYLTASPVAQGTYGTYTGTTTTAGTGIGAQIALVPAAVVAAVLPPRPVIWPQAMWRSAYR